MRPRSAKSPKITIDAINMISVIFVHSIVLCYNVAREVATVFRG